MQYEITTCDWNAEQTRLWRYWIEKHCPTARIIALPDRKPIPRCWSSGKIACFLAPFKTRNIIYLDTDVIVTGDLSRVFDEIGDAQVGVSCNLKTDKLLTSRHYETLRAIEKEIGFRMLPPNVSSGMIIIKDFDPGDLYDLWLYVMKMPIFKKGLSNHYTSEEYGLAIALAHLLKEDQFWKLPCEIHGNIYKGKRQFGTAEVPLAMHYHKIGWLKKHGFGKYAEI